MTPVVWACFSRLQVCVCVRELIPESIGQHRIDSAEASEEQKKEKGERDKWEGKTEGERAKRTEKPEACGGGLPLQVRHTVFIQEVQHLAHHGGPQREEILHIRTSPCPPGLSLHPAREGTPNAARARKRT
jgi:hypothetical protein